MARVVIDTWGTKVYSNDAYQWHREDGPALIYSNGYKEWYVNDELIKSISSDGKLTLIERDGKEFHYSSPNGHFGIRGHSGKWLWPEL